MYRIESRYPVYVGGGCIPYTIHFVQKCVHEGIFFDKWVDIKGFEDKRKAIALLNMLKGKG